MASPHFLVVDDDPDHRFVVRRMLERRGYLVDEAETAEAALEMYGAGSYDIILLDIMLPGMDGLSLLIEMRSRRPHDDTPVIFISARTDKATMLRGLEIGAIEYLTKPLDFDELHIRLSTLLRIRALQREVRSQEQALAQQKALTEMLVTIAHHINNAAAAMMLQAGVVNTADASDVEAFKHVVQQQTELITNVIKTLDFAVKSGSVPTKEYSAESSMIDLKKMLEDLSKRTATP